MICYCCKALVGLGGGTGFNLPSWVNSIFGLGGGWGFSLLSCLFKIAPFWVSKVVITISPLEDSLESNSCLGGEFVRVESESPTGIEQKQKNK